ncbi:protein spaetzle isoform X2 [Anoplophora glabripennis]|uniref:protein spaetzle isoform X2 n=1 Tax=Anoplophora glabripennis TaxID=217634 RepID=UPI0008740D58|nr:protein spaetzle isoform X2 [Anoplophora glabripennis]
MILSIYCTCVLELVNFVSGRPQHMRHYGHFNNLINETIAGDSLRRPLREAPEIKSSNKTKEERILNTSNRRGSISFGGLSEQDIIFPDSFELIYEPIPRIDGAPKCADGSTFCENFDSYPYLHLKDILRTHKINKDFFFGEDEMPPELEKRIGAEEETFVCGAVDRIIFPKIGKNKNKEWKYIVNQGREEGYVQGIRAETCRHQNAPCDIIGELPEGYRTSCKQKYIYRRLMSLNENGTPVPDTFQLPSACCCSYKREGFLSRIGKVQSVSPVPSQHEKNDSG